LRLRVWIATAPWAASRSATRPGQVERQIGLGQPVAGVAGVVRAVRGIDHEDLAGQPRSGDQDPLVVAQDVRTPVRDHRAEPSECLERRGAGATVGRQANIVLEVGERPSGDLTERPVHPPDREAELEQPVLEGRYVVTPHPATGDLFENTLAEAPAGFLQRLPRRRPHDAIDGQSTDLLEQPHTGLGGVVEVVVGQGTWIQVPQLDESNLEVGHVIATGPPAQQR